MSIFVINFFQLQMKCTPCIMWIIANVVENLQCLECVCVYVCACVCALWQFLFLHLPPLFTFWSTISLFVAATDSRKTSTTTTRAHQDINVCVCVFEWVHPHLCTFIIDTIQTCIWARDSDSNCGCCSDALWDCAYKVHDKICNDLLGRVANSMGHKKAHLALEKARIS